MEYGTSNRWTFKNDTTTACSVSDGTKTLYVEYMDNAGNRAVFSDSIILDTVAPTGTVTIDGGAAYTNDPNRHVTLTLSASG